MVAVLGRQYICSAAYSWECLALSRNRKLTIGIILIVLVTSAATFFISAFFFVGWNYFNPNYGISFNPKNVSLENIRKFSQVRNILKDNYYQNVDENVLLEGAVAGMADSLGDPYTVYYNKDQMQKILEIPKKSEENYVGIGVTIITDNNGLVTVVEPFEDSPALKAGIKQGDKIVRVNGEDVTAIKDENAVVKMIKGPENTTVKITVYRPSETRSIDFELTREKIKLVLNIRSSIVGDNVGYIRILSFMDDNIDKLFAEHLSKLLKKNIKGLVIDVRDNPGGYYMQVVNIADMLLPEGMIVYTEDRYKHIKEQKSDKNELNLPITVLINGNSASASEILAGALKDNKKATLIGTKSFGKGLVQDVIPLDDGSGVKVTTARYFTPSGVCIQGIGIQPDIEVNLGDKYKDVPVSQVPREDDLQLQTAIETVQKAAR